MPEEYADAPLQDRIYALKNVGTERFAALKGIDAAEVYTVSASDDDEARVSPDDCCPRNSIADASDSGRWKRRRQAPSSP
jgi:hypothetical protein